MWACQTDSTEVRLYMCTKKYSAIVARDGSHQYECLMRCISGGLLLAGRSAANYKPSTHYYSTTTSPAAKSRSSLDRLLQKKSGRLKKGTRVSIFGTLRTYRDHFYRSPSNHKITAVPQLFISLRCHGPGSKSLGTDMPGLEQVRDPNSMAGLSRSRANTTLYARVNDDELGSDMTENDQIGPSAVHRSYGTLPLRSRRFTLASQSIAVSFGKTLSQWSLQRVRSNSSAILRSSPSSIFSVGRLSRPISTYDDPRVKDHAEADADAKVNGIRVWYSSFTSIDWLHDTIKDSLRFSMLRKRKSLRGRLWLTFDKSLGWIIVTIVGFLTAVVAFLIVRTEQLLFDAKEGYCRSSWWSAKRFCCPHFDDEQLIVTRGDRLFKKTCPAWRTWADVLSRDQVANQNGALEFVSYTCIAVSVTCLSVACEQHSYIAKVFLAIVSCLLTLYLTDSTTFITRKESSTSPAYLDKNQNAPPEPKRKVMYYVGYPSLEISLLSQPSCFHIGCR
jgi:hypothetical protein